MTLSTRGSQPGIARDKANAAATATGTARGALDDRRAELSVAQRDALTAQNTVGGQQAADDSAVRAMQEAAAAKNKAAQASNDDLQNPVKEAEYNIRNQMFLDRLREMFDAGRKLEELKKTRDSANGAVAVKAVAVKQAETDLTSAEANQVALGRAAVEAEKKYADLEKEYEKNRKNGHARSDQQ